MTKEKISKIAKKLMQQSYEVDGKIYNLKNLGPGAELPLDFLYFEI